MGRTAYLSAFSGKVDRENGVILGVSVITTGQAEGHGITIDDKTLSQVKASGDSFQDGVPVKVDHGTSFENIVGTIKNFRIEGGQLRGDIYLLKSHDLFSRLLDISDKMSKSIGLSIRFDCSEELVDGHPHARCGTLYSVDFVESPAANPTGLFSSHVDSPPKVMAEKSVIEQVKEFLGLSKELAAPVIELETKLRTKETELSTVQKSLEELTGKVTALEAKHGEEIKKLENSVEDRASKKALEISAAQGIPPVKGQTPATDPSQPPKAKLTCFAAIRASIATDPEVAAALAARTVQFSKG